MPREPAGRSHGWLRLAVGVAGLGIATYVLAGSRGQLQQAADALSHVRPQWVVVAVLAEAVSYLCAGAGLRTLLGGRPGLRTVTTIAVTAQAAANCLPGGAAVSAVITFRQLRRRYVAARVATGAVVLQNLLQAFALPLLALVGGQLATGAEPIPGLRLLSTFMLGVAVAGAVALVVLRRHRLPARAWTALTATWARLHTTVPRRLAARLPTPRPASDGGPVALQGIRAARRPQVVSAAAGLALAYWLTDALCLSAAFPAVGAGVPWGGLLVSYSAAQLASVLPFTPGGLGVVEGSLTVGLVAYGGSTSSALSAVLLYRLISFWALLPIGGVGGLLLRRSAPRSEPRGQLVASATS